MKKSIAVLVFIIIILSMVSGSVFQMSLSPSEEIQSYLNEFLWNLKNGVRSKNIFINALSDNLMTLAVIVICGFVKLGFVPSLLVTARKCFLTAFSVSAFMNYYKLQGFFGAATLALPFMILLPSLFIICTVSISLSHSNNRRFELRPYFVFTFVCTVIFTASAATEGYVVPRLILLILH